MRSPSATLFFDLGNVLLFFCHDRMCRQLASFCRVDEESVRRLLFTEGLAPLYERGSIDSRALHARFCALAHRDLSFAGLMRAASDIFEPNLPLFPLIKELKGKGHRLILLSNTCEAHFDFAYLHFPILHLFDAFILSYQVGSLKPEPAIFQAALSQAVGPNFYVDDIPAHVASAKQCGLDGEPFISYTLLVEHLSSRGYL
jgi:putative hydrolase of the HAD superfamily